MSRDRYDRMVAGRLDRLSRAVTRMAPGSLGGRASSAAPESRPRMVVERHSNGTAIAKRILDSGGQTITEDIPAIINQWTTDSVFSLDCGMTWESNTYLVAQTEGVYVISAGLGWDDASATAGVRRFSLIAECGNGFNAWYLAQATDYHTGTWGGGYGGVFGTRQNVSGIAHLGVGDKVSAEVWYRDSGASLGLTSADEMSFFAGYRLSGCECGSIVCA